MVKYVFCIVQLCLLCIIFLRITHVNSPSISFILMLSIISWHERIIVYSLLLMAIWAVSSLSIMSKTAISIGMQGFQWNVFSLCLKKIHKSFQDIEQMCVYILNNIPNNLQRIYTFLHSQKQCLTVPVTACPCQHLMLSRFCFSNPSRYIVVYHGNFNSISLMARIAYWPFRYLLL